MSAELDTRQFAPPGVNSWLRTIRGRRTVDQVHAEVLRMSAELDTRQFAPPGVNSWLRTIAAGALWTRCTRKYCA